MYLLIAVLLQAISPEIAAPAPAARVESGAQAPTDTSAAPSATVSEPPPAAIRRELRCERRAPTGQRISRRVCETVEFIDDRAVVAQDVTNAITHSRGVSQ